MLRRLLPFVLLLSLGAVGCSEEQSPPVDPNDNKPTCGNGKLDPGEKCDPEIESGQGVCPLLCDDADVCTADQLIGSDDDCTAECLSVPITQCATGDGCCPVGCNALTDADCSATCGNGIVEVGEKCDGNCPISCDDGNSCTADALTGSPTACNAECTHTSITECRGGDGCCAPGCNSNTDSDCSTSCGNGIVEGNELCDGNCPTVCNDNNACTADVLSGTPTSCNVVCSHNPITTCQGGDNCCPAGCNANTDSDCSASCGNGVIEANETCDGNCPTDCNDGNACTADVKTGSPGTCNVTCTNTPITQCVSGDGCCPSGCNAVLDNDCNPRCGNGVVEGTERCDGNCVSECNDGSACTTDTLQGSAQTCDARCVYTAVTQCVHSDGCCAPGCNALNDNDCNPTCGNGVIEPGETCDNNCPANCNDGNACTTDTMSGSATNCTAACTNTPITVCQGGDGCCAPGCNSTNDNDCSASCGNGVKEGNETCDGADCPTSCDDGNACTKDTLIGSAQQCNAQCTFSQITTCSMTSDGCCPAGCNSLNDTNCGATCGNGVVEPPETCDDNCPTVCNDNDACTTDALSGQANECNVRCTSTPITACSMTSDGCCPANCNSLNDADCQPVCPNGVVEAGEKCDGNCPTSCDDGNACTANTLIGSAAQCTAECTYSTISQCSMTSDGCCPSGCTSINDVDCDSSGLIGDPCTSGGECVSGACLDEANTGWSGGYCTAACGDPALNPTECGSGAHCAAYDAESGYGFCFRDCANNNSCRTPYYQCFDWDGDGTRSECAPVASGTGTVGAPCDSIHDCAGGQLGFCLFEEYGWRNGYCTLTCSTSCPSGSHCALVDAGEGICMQNCASTANCRADGYVCGDGDGAGTNECFPAATGTGAVGDACAGTWECAGGLGGLCYSAENGWKDGYCMQECSNTVTCPTGSRCAYKDASGNGLCLDNCSTNNECRSGVGYQCVNGDFSSDNSKECHAAATGTGAPGAACTELWDCSGGLFGFCYTGLPNGYCLIECTAGTGTCPSGSFCTSALSDTAQFCADSCASPAECRSADSYQCMNFGDGNGCWFQ